MAKRDERELLQRWQAGDAEAGNELVIRHFDAVRLFFLNAVSDREREDLLQETFKRVVAAVGTFEGRSSFRTFLFVIARRTLYDHLRQRYRGKGQFDEMTHSVVDQGASPSHLVTQIESHRRLLQCLRGLPVQTKELLELYYWQDMTGNELAEIQGIPERTLRSRLGTARKALRDCFVRCAPAAGDADEPDLEGALRELGEFFRTGRG
ncbi:RNA polymerase sigma-70 factor [Plesiocystis pacifica SIR-1]|uniref:RNA polymerase sigma-70 factor n=1 Tax=Plesiocystis pacifica SIR-1 TaxID=391625 RepID=A6G797_9BACT|nr:sigma-70 family RNA polymerase sigma factor [Plesiocystis pacifica]EDM78231.1 RNA polymerase sigma-70 factor [Plesiocystis pacifica SIR-1]